MTGPEVVERIVAGLVERLVLAQALWASQGLRRFRPQHRECW